LTTASTTSSYFGAVTDCYESQYLFLSSGDHRGDGTRLGTVAHWVRGVFNIASNVDISTKGQNRSANQKVRIRCIRTGLNGLGLLKKFLNMMF
jgi:hypothetical protein